MNSLKSKWDELTTPIKSAVGVGAALVGVVFVLKILPALIAGLGFGALIAILFVPYWTPTIVAFIRKHPSKLGILAVNFFFGWTFIGWVLSLVWALSDNSGRAGTQSVVVNTTVSPTFMVGNGHVGVPHGYEPSEVASGQWQEHQAGFPRTPSIPPWAKAGPNQ